MLYYKKSVKLQKGNLIKLSYTNFSNINSSTDENILPLKYAKCAYNFIMENGALKTGFGMSDATLPNISTLEKQNIIVGNAVKPHKIWYYKYFSNSTMQKQHKLVMLDKNGRIYTQNVYFNNEPRFYRIFDVNLSLDSVAVNYNLNGEDVLLISSPDGSMGYINGSGNYIAIQNAENRPDITDMVIHYERLFAIGKKNPKRVYFSDDLDPTNWTININDAGFIDLVDERGDVKRVFSFNDYLFILREFGISKISAFGDQEQFYVNHCYTSNTRIYENTACLCGEKLIFLARDGLYCFNGISTTKLSLNIENLFDENNSNANSCFYNGCYFLSCKLNYEDNEEDNQNYINNTLICYNLKTGAISITRGIDVSYMLALQDENISDLLCLFNTNYVYKIGKLTKNGKFFDTNSKKMWISPLTDLGYGDKRKVIKDIYVRTKYNCYINVITDHSSTKIKVYGKNNISRVPVNIIGNLIAINFETTEQFADISNPQLIINLLGSL